MAGKEREFIDDGGLLAALFVLTDAKAQARARILWDRIGLPEPQLDEYFAGDHGVYVYLNSHGLVFNFRNRRFPNHGAYDARNVRHDRILQPLYSRDLSAETTFEICPGIRRTSIDPSMVTDLSKTLKGDGLRFYDANPWCVGILPGGAPVVANRAAIRMKKPAADMEIPAQEHIFGGLSRLVTSAFRSASPVAIKSALQVCKDIAELKNSDPEKILYGSWTNSAILGPKKANIVEAADNYARRLAMA